MAGAGGSLEAVPVQAYPGAVRAHQVGRVHQRLLPGGLVGHDGNAHLADLHVGHVLHEPAAEAVLGKHQAEAPGHGEGEELALAVAGGAAFQPEGVPGRGGLEGDGVHPAPGQGIVVVGQDEPGLFREEGAAVPRQEHLAP